MSPHAGRLALVCFAHLVLILDQVAAQAQTLRGRLFSDKAQGYEISIPPKWVRLPTNVEEQWIVGRFLAEKETLGSAKAGDSLMGHKPAMKIILFDDTEIRKFVEVEKDGGVTSKTLKRPYLDYKDYVKRNLSGGGFFFSQEEAGTSRGIKVMKYEVKLEKLASDKKRYIGWVFAGEGRKIAVEFEVLESQFKKLRSPLYRALGSFKFIEREVVAKNGKVDKALNRSFTREEWAKMPVTERQEFRVGLDEAREKKMLARLPEGWAVTRAKHFLVLNHGDKRYAKRILAAAEAFRSWLDDRFSGLSDEYAMQAVLRICKNDEEYRSYYSGSSQTRFNFRNREIVLYDDRSNIGISSGPMFWQIYSFYMRDKAPELLFRAPIWLDQGLDSYISSAVLKGRRLSFPRSVSEFVAFAELRRGPEGRIKTARELLHLDSLDSLAGMDRKDARELRLGSQVATFYRFIEGPGQRLKFLRSPDFVVSYMRAVQSIAAESDGGDGIEIDSEREATTEAEEEEQAQRSGERWKRYAEQAKANRAEFLAKLDQKIETWSPEQWEALERAYRSYHNKKTR